MRILISTQELSETALFDLVVQQSVTTLLDLRQTSGHVPPILSAIYHRPTRVTLMRTLQRLLTAETPSHTVFVILADREQVEDLSATLQRFRPDIQLEFPETVRTA